MAKHWAGNNKSVFTTVGVTNVKAFARFES